MAKNKTKTICIAGKIVGCDLPEIVQKINNACDTLQERYKTDRIFNPCIQPGIPNKDDWFRCLMLDLECLPKCDMIYMLKDWRDSIESIIHHEVAKKLGLEIIYEEGGEE